MFESDHDGTFQSICRIHHVAYVEKNESHVQIQTFSMVRCLWWTARKSIQGFPLPIRSSNDLSLDLSNDERIFTNQTQVAYYHAAYAPFIAFKRQVLEKFTPPLPL